MKKKILFSISFAACFWIAAIFALRASPEQETSTETLPTYYSYPAKELDEFKKLDSKIFISPASLQQWDDMTHAYATSHHLSYQDSLRVFTYLYMAQREVAFLIYNALDHFEGSLDSISESILKQFFSDYLRPKTFVTDSFSEKVSALVFPKFKKRIDQENAISFRFEGKDTKQSYQDGVQVAKWIPWIVAPQGAYRPTPPPSAEDAEWKRQINRIKQGQKHLSDEQRQAVYFWAGAAGPGTGDWRKIANDFMFDHDIPLGKTILVRSVLMAGLYDATIACFDAKYHYSVIRPQARDPSVTYLIPCPNHPSYPSGHSTEGAVTAVILSYYFPDEAKEWKRLAEEAGMSRIWAGIHYPLDHDAGKAMGTRIGQLVIENEAMETPSTRE